MLVKTVFLCAVFFLLGAVAGMVVAGTICLRIIRKLRETVRDLKEGREVPMPQKTETSKRIIWVCLAMGFLWVWCSYLLAWLNHPQIAESLSQVAVTEIIGVVLAYCVKATMENLSKYNHWPDKRPEITPEEPESDEPAG